MSTEMMLLSAIKDSDCSCSCNTQESVCNDVDNIINIGADTTKAMEAISAILAQVVKIVEGIDKPNNDTSKIGDIDDILAILGGTCDDEDTKVVEYIAKLIKEIYDGVKPVGDSLKLGGKSLDEIKAELLANISTELTVEQKKELTKVVVESISNEQKQQLLDGVTTEVSEEQKQEIVNNIVTGLTDEQKQQLLDGVSIELSDEQKKALADGMLAELSDEQKQKLTESVVTTLTDEQKEAILDGVSIELSDEQKRALETQVLAKVPECEGFDYKVDANPATDTNPTKERAVWLNSATAELFVCTDNTADANVWVGNKGTRVGVLLYGGFETILYTGNGANQLIVCKEIESGVDFVWYKRRDSADFHGVFDSIRGENKLLRTNSSSAELYQTYYISSLNKNSFTAGSSSSVNASSGSYVAWVASLPNHNPSNTNGSVASETKSNGFMSAISYRGTGGNFTVGHGLSKKPELVLFKSRDNNRNWMVDVAGLGTKEFLYLNSSNAIQSAQSVTFGEHTEDVLNLPGAHNEYGYNENYIAYAFASLDGVCKVGEYTGTGSPNNKINCGFEPQFVMIKKIVGDNQSQWTMYDNKRRAKGTEVLYANSSGAEDNDSSAIELTSTGFTCKTSFGYTNETNHKYIYLAIAKGAM
jgi:uncharacterized protein (DUF1778 family)